MIDTISSKGAASEPATMTTPYKGTDLATAEETMAALGKTFELNVKITDYIVKELKVKSLQEFRYLATNDDQVDTVIFRGITNLEEPVKKLMLARLRRAWNAVRANLDDLSRVRIRGDDQEDEISAVILDELKINLWNRHKMFWRPETFPADSLVGKLHRQIDKRTLTVFPLGSVKTLAHQASNPPKRRRVSEVFVIDLGQDDVHEICHSISDYLDKLFTLCLAYASAGSKATAGAAALTTKETQDSDTTDYIVAPLDVMLGYHARAVALSREIPARDRHEYIRRLDEAERAVWVSDFRHTTLDFGKVVLNVFRRRDAHWSYHAVTPPMQERPMQPSPRTPDHNKSSQPQPITSPGKGAGKGGKGAADAIFTPGSPALTLKNGEKLCQAYNSKAGCMQGRDCPNGQHRCSMTTRNKRACGGSSHNFQDCRSGP